MFYRQLCGSIFVIFNIMRLLLEGLSQMTTLTSALAEKILGWFSVSNKFCKRPLLTNEHL